MDRLTLTFRAKVALEAIRGELTLAELAAKHGIHQTMIATWKKQAVEGMAATFSGKAEAVQATSEAELAKLHAKIGQLVIEKDLYQGFGVKRGVFLGSVTALFFSPRSDNVGCVARRGGQAWPEATAGRRLGLDRLEHGAMLGLIGPGTVRRRGRSSVVRSCAWRINLYPLAP